MLQYVGIDVSKDRLDCLWLRDPEKKKIKTKVLNNQSKSFQQLADWLVRNTKTDPADISVVIEATGIYHEAVAMFLYDQGFRVSVVNPARPKKFAESQGNVHKTDKKDSLVLAEFGRAMQPSRWKPEPMEVRELKALLARLQALEADWQREFNRLEKAQINAPSDVVLESLKKMLDVLAEEKTRLTQDIDDHIDKHPQLKKNRQLLESIPGVGPVVSRIMLAVIASRQFTRASQLAAFLGLIPKLRESGKLKGRTTLSKQGPALVRAKLYMAAVVAKSVNPCISNQYNRLINSGKTRMQAIGAAMRKLAQICFGVVKHQSEYQPQIA